MAERAQDDTKRVISVGIRDNFKKGTLEMLVLSLLAESDLYGYQFPQLISERMGGVIEVSEGSLYPILYRLEDDGFITSARVPTGRRRVLVYYHLEQNGWERLRETISEYRIFSDGIQRFLDSCQLPSEEVAEHEYCPKTVLPPDQETASVQCRTKETLFGRDGAQRNSICAGET